MLLIRLYNQLGRPQPAADTKEVDSQPQVHDQLNHESRCSSSSSLGQLCLSSAEVTVITSEPSMPAEKPKPIYVPAEKAKTIYVPAEDEKLASIPSDKEKLSAPPVAALIEKEKAYIFKDPNFVHSVRGCMTGGKKTRAWKSLKQIISAEKAAQWHPDAPIYGAIDSPPSMKPAKKYSDVSGLPGKYRDPQTKLMFYSSLEFNHIRCLPGDIVGGYLSLRKADNPAGWYRP
ncbi:PREDICTED: INO80 complex subunit C-like isoform X2 [Priapulus caudatus]|uniref:INO80 complex subunit C-like isoform X2 n=1 Tax=Priapulus caudatus TaxID=37621 RepID=A0ABM1F8S6_PRICU|nr:PREDICTED: INO80 complex subunit C-like isoform X2 [Priapulus caudatus]